MLHSLIGRYWTRTCLVPDKTTSCPLSQRAGRSGKTISDERSTSTMRPGPPSGSGPQCSKRSPSSHGCKLAGFPGGLSADNTCLCVPHRDGEVERQRRQVNCTDGGHDFITRRQISDPDESNTRESPEVN